MKSTVLLFAFLWFAPLAARSQIVVFSFNGAAGSELTIAPDAQPTYATVSSMSRGTGLTASSSAGTFSSSGWTTSSSPDAADYYSFSIAPNDGGQLSLSTLTLDERRSSTGIRDWSIRSSLDNFTADLSHFAVPDDANTRTGQATSLGASFEGLLTGVEFRIYGYNSESSGSGTWRIDNVTLAGSYSFSAVPEPEEYALTVGAGLFAFAVLRKARWWERFRRRNVCGG